MSRELLIHQRAREESRAATAAPAPNPAVDHPKHYNMGNLEVIDVIDDWNLGFSLGNAIKYIARADHKGSPIQDLEKAAWYLAHEIEKRKQQALKGNGI